MANRTRQSQARIRCIHWFQTRCYSRKLSSPLRPIYLYAQAHCLQVRQYEVLIGNRNGVRWVRTSGKLDVSSLGARPVEGGHEDNGSPLYIARGRTKKGNLYPGKASSVLKGAYVTEGDDEVNVSVSAILCDLPMEY